MSAPETVRVGYVMSGSQKAGTTSLSLLLRHHPQLAQSPAKEWHYIDDERRDWSEHDFADYRVPRTDPRQVMTGDATPLYLWWPQALERLHRYDPQLRHLVLVRDPIERLVSQWQMVTNRWPTHAGTWQEFLTVFAPAALESRIPPRTNVHAYRMRSGIVRGYYGAQLQRGFEVFGRDAFLVLDMRAFLGDHVTTLHRVTDFLGLDRLDAVGELPHGMKGKPAASPDLPTREQIAGLVERYAADLDLFEQLSGIDVSHWPTRAVLDGRLGVEELTARVTMKFSPLSDPLTASPAPPVPAAGAPAPSRAAAP